MAFIGESFVKAVPSSLGPIFQLHPVPLSGIEVWIENLSPDNSITWKIQDSDDGVTWEDRAFNTTDCNTTATTFTLIPGGNQSVRVVRRKAYTRLVGSAITGTNAHIRVDWNVTVPLSGVTYLQG